MPQATYAWQVKTQLRIVRRSSQYLYMYWFTHVIAELSTNWPVYKRLLTGYTFYTILLDG